MQKRFSMTHNESTVCMSVVTPWGFSPIHAPEPAHTCAEADCKDVGSRQGLQYQRQTDRPLLHFRCSIHISKSSRTIHNIYEATASILERHKVFHYMITNKIEYVAYSIPASM